MQRQTCAEQVSLHRQGNCQLRIRRCNCRMRLRRKSGRWPKCVKTVDEQSRKDDGIRQTIFTAKKIPGRFGCGQGILQFTYERMTLLDRFLFNSCLNDVLCIASAVKDTDDADLPVVVINQIIHDEVIYRKKTHSHGRPWFSFDSCVSFWKEVGRADGLTYPVHLALGILGSELFESNIGINSPQVIE